MCTVIHVAVMADNYGCMKAVTSQTGWAILQNRYWSFNSLVLFLVSLLTGWQSYGHNMYGFNSSCFSAGVFAVKRWVTLDAGAFYQFW